MSHIWMRHVTHMNESCHTYECVMSHIYEWVMSHVRMSHVTRMNASCHTYEWVNRWVKESCHTYEWVRPHLWISHVTHMNDSIVAMLRRSVCMLIVVCHTYEWVMSPMWRSQETFARCFRISAPLERMCSTLIECVLLCARSRPMVDVSIAVVRALFQNMFWLLWAQRMAFQNIGSFEHNVWLFWYNVLYLARD